MTQRLEYWTSSSWLLGGDLLSLFGGANGLGGF
jgi:hypothetical protein